MNVLGKIFVNQVSFLAFVCWSE